MKRTLLLAAAGLAFLVWSTAPTWALNLFQPGDFAVAIDLDTTAGSSSPASGNEDVYKILDNDSGSKYLNFGITRTGFIVTPNTYAALQSFVLTTANDAEERDPINYEVYGTNSSIQSQPHSQGIQENWTLISSGPVTLPSERRAVGPAIDFTNATAYSSYKVIFPEVKNIRNGEDTTANSMQIADVSFFTGLGGTGTSMLDPNDFIIPVRDMALPSSNSPAAEGAPNAIDRNIGSKYLNFGKENSGLIVTPSLGPSVANGIKITTANDWNQRDPMTFRVYGTNEEITTPINGIGDEQDWTLIAEGSFNTPTDRFTESEIVNFTNDQSYASYRIVFPTLRDAAATNSMQIAEVQLIADDPATLVVNRQTGEVTIRAEQDIAFSGYRIASLSSEGLNDAAWNSITASGADPNDTWEITSVPGAQDILAEQALPTGANDGFILSAGNSLSLGHLWTAMLPGSFEDLNFSLFGTNGKLIADAIVYEGAEIQLGDYSGNGTIGPEDWAIFRAGFGGNFQGLTAAEAYLSGDLDGDFDSDIYDFNRLIAMAGGPAALMGTSAVPEPSAVWLLTVAVIGGITWRTRRRISPRAVAILAAMVIVPLTASNALGQFTSLGAPIGVTTPDEVENENSTPSNLFDDDVLDDFGGTQINSDLFAVDYNQITADTLQYAGQGSAPKTVFLDYGSPVTANWFAYAQRSGSDTSADRVGMFELWFSNTAFNDTLPNSPADAVVTIDSNDQRLRDSTLRPYTLGGEKTGQYVAIRFTVSELSANRPVNNIGGHEFRLMTGPSDVVLEVDRATGAMTLYNNGANAANIELEAITIDSPSGGLNPEGFTGIGGQSGFPDGTGTGNGWEVGEGSNAKRLVEANFSGSSILASGASGLSLGNGYNPLTLAEDLTFRWTSHFYHNGEFKTKMFDGVVNYVGIAPDILLGDYYDDGVVDAADYTVWRNHLGTTTALPNDSTPGSVDIDDYERWKSNFGANSPGALAANVSPVPEPHAVVLSLLVTIVGATAIRRTKVFESR